VRHELQLRFSVSRNFADKPQAGVNLAALIGRELMSNREAVSGCGALFGVMAANMAFAQKQGGVLRVFHRDSPA